MNTEAKVPTENSNKQNEQASSICSRMQGWFNNQVTNVNHCYSMQKVHDHINRNKASI